MLSNTQPLLLVTDKKSEQYELLVNNALNTLTADAKGPVHLNLQL